MNILGAALGIVWRIPYLSRLVNRLVIDRIASRTTPRPRAFSLWSPSGNTTMGDLRPAICDYTSWRMLTDKHYSGRHLPPADENWVAALPPDAPPDPRAPGWGAITALFERKGTMRTDRSSLLFMFFAQWFTDSVMRIDPMDRRRNTSNHEVDLCQIYGLDEVTARTLRHMQGGRLRSQMIDGEEMPDYLCEPDGTGGWKVRDRYCGLPYASRMEELFGAFPPERREKLYAVGLERGNQSVGYVAISTLFLREHNRLASELERRNPDWDDERLFQTARMINTVLLLKILVEDYINHVAGHRLFRLDTGFAETKRWYRSNWITLEFDLLYRWHGMVPDTMELAGRQCASQVFRVNNALFEEAGLSSILAGLSRQPAGRIGLGNTASFLLPAEYRSVRLGRDFRLQSYNAYREAFSLRPLRSFDELTTDATVRAQLRELYGDISKLELVTGLFAEDPAPGALFGELMHHMVSYDAFTQILTNPLLSRNVFHVDTFTRYGLDSIMETDSLQQLVDRNVNTATKVSLGFASVPR